jgi:hypothetical protein
MVKNAQWVRIVTETKFGDRWKSAAVKMGGREEIKNVESVYRK